MISVGNNKAVICKGDFHPAALYKGDKKIAGYTVEDFEGTGGAMLENCYNDKLHNAQIFGNSIQDGTPTPESPVEIQSVGELVTEGDYAGKYRVPVRVRGKNLFSESIYPLTVGKWVNGVTGGEGSTDASYSSTGYISCDSFLGKTITLSPTRGFNTGIAFYNADKEFLSGKKYASQKSCTVVVPENAVYMKFTVPVASKDVFQVEFGDTATEYEPYIEPQTFDIYLDEPLMKMTYYNRIFADYIDFEKSMVVKYNYKEIYDGTESWEIRSTSYPNTFSKRITQARTVLCSHYKTAGSGGVDMTAKANNSARIFITDSRFSTVEEFKAFLAQQSEAGTPVEAVFLSITAYNGSPAEKAIELPEIPTKYGCTNIYEIDTSIAATISGKYKKVEV